METDTQVGKLRSRHKALLTERSEWLTDWRTLAEHFLPRRFRALDESSVNTNKPGLTDTLVNNESVRAMRVLAAGMQGGMTSPARPWFRLGVPEPEIEQASTVKEWLADVQRILLNVMARSNFYDAIHQVYAELGTFGTTCVFALEDDDTVVRYRTLTTGEYCLISGAEGRIKGVFRMIDMTAEQMVEKFGQGAVSPAVLTAFKDHGTKDTWFQVVHVVLPNPKRAPKNLLNGQSKSFESFYYEYAKDSETASPHMLEYGGYESQPFAGPRWDVIGSDIYGRGPGMDALNDVKMLQSMSSTLLKAMHKQADPPVVAPTDFWDINTVPGGINYIDTNKSEQLRPLYQVKADVAGAAALIQQTKDDIREGLYNDLFKMLAISDRGNMTATEVKQRIEEKLIMLGPVIERLHAELLDVLIDRTFDICLRRGLLPPPPEELQGRELKVEYISLLAQAQKMIGTSAIDQFMAMVGTYAEIFPEMADIPDIDEVGNQYSEMLGVDPKLIRGQDDRDERRDAREAAMAAQAEMEKATQGAQAIRDIGGAVPDSMIEGALGGTPQ